MHFHTYIDSGVAAGATTIAGISTQGSEYGVGISSDIQGRNISVTGIVSCSELKVGTGVTANSGILTAVNGFSSGSTPITISISGNTLTFSAVGIGSASLTLA